MGDLDGYLHWLDKNSGQLRGRIRAADDAIETAPLVRDDIVYVLGTDGELSALRLRAD